jgi:hypothetical protein
MSHKDGGLVEMTLYDPSSVNRPKYTTYYEGQEDLQVWLANGKTVPSMLRL